MPTEYLARTHVDDVSVHDSAYIVATTEPAIHGKIPLYFGSGGETRTDVYRLIGRYPHSVSRVTMHDAR